MYSNVWSSGDTGVPGTPYLTAWANSGKSGRARREQALRLMAIRQAGLEPLALSDSGHERLVNGRAAASGEEKFDLPEAIARFGDILNMEGPLVEIGSRSVFVNSAVIRSIFSTCNALGQDGLPTLPEVPPSVCYPSGRHRQRRRPKPGGQRNLDPRIGRERASRHGDCQHHGSRGPAVRGVPGTRYLIFGVRYGVPGTTSARPRYF